MQPGSTINPGDHPDAPQDQAPTPNWNYAPDEAAQAAQNLDAPSTDAITWTASEFVDHEKGGSWFFGLAGVTILTIVILYFMTHDFITSGVVILAASLFGITAARKPRILQFQISGHGVQIGTKFYPYANFKSFTIIEEGALNSIQLLPLKRFLPTISLYYPPEQAEQITDVLGSYLPHEDRPSDPIDRLMRRVRF